MSYQGTTPCHYTLLLHLTTRATTLGYFEMMQLYFRVLHHLGKYHSLILNGTITKSNNSNDRVTCGSVISLKRCGPGSLFQTCPDVEFNFTHLLKDSKDKNLH